MKIKLALLEEDQNYLSRIVSVFGIRYADKLEVYSFTEQEIAMSALEKNRIDIFISSEVFDIDMSRIPKRCGFAYFVDSPDVGSINEQMAICKFQKVDLIYKQILSICAEQTGSISGLTMSEYSTKIILFCSPCGGAGTSSVAASCALYHASQHKKTLYLNLEKFSMADVFFSGEGSFDMSDVIYALKSKKTNFAMKLESCVKQDASGVYFFSGTKEPLDMMELSPEDRITLIAELKMLGNYDYIIIDTDYSMDKKEMSVYKQAYAVIWIGDGTEISNLKIKRAYRALSILEKNVEVPIMRRLSMLYNRFQSQTGMLIEDIELPNLGTISFVESIDSKQIILEMSLNPVFGKIL